MADPLETYRGCVYRWEVDHNDHLTVAYYFERFGRATLTFLDALGLGVRQAARERRSAVTTDCYVKYQHELRVGDLLHMTTGVIGIEADALTLGHRVVNSETGAVCATVEQRVRHVALGERDAVPLSGAARDAAERHRIDWDGPPREPRTQPRGVEGFRDSARDGVPASAMDAIGETDLSFYIHRFSAANGHAIAGFGMTPSYMRDERRGFSTFEFRVTFGGALRVGDVVSVKSGILHVGSSSVRVFHTMIGDRTGEVVATLDQFGVHLDMDARRPTPLPDTLREKARALLAPSA